MSKYYLYILTQTLISCHVTIIRDKRELRYRLPEIAIYDVIDKYDRNLDHNVVILHKMSRPGCNRRAEIEQVRLSEFSIDRTINNLPSRL